MNELFLAAGVAVWFTGYPSSGKTTIARALERRLEESRIPVITLDGDEIRPIVAKDLGFSERERKAVLYRYIDLCRIMLRAKVLTTVVVNNHAEQQRETARQAFPSHQFVQVWVDTPVEICKERDVKGLYKAAAEGRISHLVGVDIAFERPEKFDIRISTPDMSIDESVQLIIDSLLERGMLTTGH